jgi:hypothetical protein
MSITPVENSARLVEVIAVSPAGGNGQLLVRKFCNSNPNDHQTAANPLGSDGESDPSGTKQGHTTVGSLGAGARVEGDQTGPTKAPKLRPTRRLRRQPRGHESQQL